MATATQQRAYARRLNQIVRENAKLEDATVRRMVQFLQELRQQIAGELATAENFELFRLSEFDANLKSMIDGFQARLGAEVRAAITTSNGNGQALGLEPLKALGFDVSYFQPSQSQLNVVLDYTADLITDIGAQTLKAVNQQIKLAVLGQNSTIDAMRAVTKALGLGRAGKLETVGGVAYNAERIVRTEMNRAFNLASHEQNTESAKQIPGLLKRWLATGDDRTRASHLAAHVKYQEEPIPVDEPFVVGGAELMFPGDPAGPAKETINCRCKSVPVLPEVGVITGTQDEKVAAQMAASQQELPVIPEPPKIPTRTLPEVPTFKTAQDGFWWIEDNLETKVAAISGQRITTETIHAVAKELQEFEYRTGSGIRGGILFDNTAFKTRKNTWAYWDNNRQLLIMRGDATKSISMVAKANEGYPNWFASPTFKGQFNHELAHAIDGGSRWNYARAMSQIPLEEVRRVSVYATSDWGDPGNGGAEAFAEAVSAYVTGKEDRLSTGIIGIIKRVYRK